MHSQASQLKIIYELYQFYSRSSKKSVRIAFRGIANGFGRVQYVLKLSLLSSYLIFILRSSKKSFSFANQGIARQSESTKDLAIKNLYAKRDTFLSYKTLSFSSKP
jgi:hypothetical protein